MQTLADLQQGDYDSPYPCATCHHPLYIQLNRQREVCLQPGCAQWPADYSSVANADESHAPRVYEELEDKRARILERIRRCDLASVRRFAHEERRKLGQSFLNAGAMRISDWHAISELLLLTQSEPSKRLHTPGGGDEATFRSILGETSSWAESMRFLGGISQKSLQRE